MNIVDWRHEIYLKPLAVYFVNQQICKKKQKKITDLWKEVKELSVSFSLCQAQGNGSVCLRPYVTASEQQIYILGCFSVFRKLSRLMRLRCWLCPPISLQIVEKVFTKPDLNVTYVSWYRPISIMFNFMYAITAIWKTCKFMKWQVYLIIYIYIYIYIYSVMTTRSMHNIIGYIEMAEERIACGWDGRCTNSADKWRCVLSRCNAHWTQRLNSR